MSNQERLRIVADIAQLDVVRRFVEERALALGASADTALDVVLAVYELTVNSVSHGYCGRPGPLEVELRRTGDTLEVRLRDEAPPFDPRSVPPPDITAPLERRKPGGLGIHMARHFVDTMDHCVTPQGGNEITLRKQLAAPRGAS